MVGTVDELIDELIVELMDQLMNLKLGGGLGGEIQMQLGFSGWCGNVPAQGKQAFQEHTFGFCQPPILTI